MHLLADTVCRHSAGRRETVLLYRCCGALREMGARGVFLLPAPAGMAAKISGVAATTTAENTAGLSQEPATVGRVALPILLVVCSGGPDGRPSERFDGEAVALACAATGHIPLLQGDAAQLVAVRAAHDRILDFLRGGRTHVMHACANAHARGLALLGKWHAEGAIYWPPMGQHARDTLLFMPYAAPAVAAACGVLYDAALRNEEFPTHELVAAEMVQRYAQALARFPADAAVQAAVLYCVSCAVNDEELARLVDTPGLLLACLRAPVRHAGSPAVCAAAVGALCCFAQAPGGGRLSGGAQADEALRAALAALRAHRGVDHELVALMLVRLGRLGGGAGGGGAGQQLRRATTAPLLARYQAGGVHRVGILAALLRGGGAA